MRGKFDPRDSDSGVPVPDGMAWAFGKRVISRDLQTHLKKKPNKQAKMLFTVAGSRRASYSAKHSRHGNRWTQWSPVLSNKLDTGHQQHESMDRNLACVNSSGSWWWYNGAGMFFWNPLRRKPSLFPCALYLIYFSLRLLTDIQLFQLNLVTCQIVRDNATAIYSFPFNDWSTLLWVFNYITMPVEAFYSPLSSLFERNCDEIHCQKNTPPPRNITYSEISQAFHQPHFILRPSVRSSESSVDGSTCTRCSEVSTMSGGAKKKPYRASKPKTFISVTLCGVNFLTCT